MIPYSLHTLSNGLRVVVHEAPEVAKAAVNLVYRVGSRHEDPARTGLAHLFEHLMFEGSVHVPHYDHHLQRAGAENNAFTTADLTCYYITLPADQLETAFWLESDRMLGLAFSEAKLALQQSVVIEEFKQRYLNQPYGDAYLHLRPLAYQVHPYRWMTIGEKIEHIEAVTLAEVEAFFYSHYAPNNCTLVVAGGVKTEAVLRLAERWFGPIPRRALASNVLPNEPEATAPRSLTLHRNVPAAHVYTAYGIPARAEAAYYAPDFLIDLLGHGKASRLYRRLVLDTELCTRVGAFNWGLHDPGLVTLFAELAPGTSVAQYEAELAGVLAGLDTLQPDELARAATKLEAAEAFERTEVANRALALALFDAQGQLEELGSLLERYRALTVDDLLAARDRYLAPHRARTLYYLPAQAA